MNMKLILARAAHRVEQLLEKITRGPARDKPIIDCYGGYTSGDNVILRGRVLAQARKISAAGPQSKWRNFVDFLSLFQTDELSGVDIVTQDALGHAVTDEEGFFTLIWPMQQTPPPTHIQIRAAGSDALHTVPVFSSVDKKRGIISDIDDTLLQTGAYSLLRNLWTSATGNVHTRKVFEDAVHLLKMFDTQGACFFYVSSSPWNLYGYLQAIFHRTGLPLGPFFLRDLGISDTQFITGTHGDHKTASIELILAANPHLSFTLVGDTGQHDPHIYSDIVARHPGRIERVILRRPNEAELSLVVLDDLAKMRAHGAAVSIDYDYRNVLEDIVA